MTDFSLDGLRGAGFVGFAAIRDIYGSGGSSVPAIPAVYVVARSGSVAPPFLPVSRGGHFKGRNPTVDIELARDNWVDGTDTLYIGKADILQRRLRQLLDFGNGRPVGHWGGRLLWQISDIDDAVVAWRHELDPRAAERRLLVELFDEFGALPYANLTR